MATLEKDGLIQACAFFLYLPGCGPSLFDRLKPSVCCSHRQNELKEGAQRSVGRQYFYVDYKRFCNVVKWRVAEMHRVIDTGLRNVSPILCLVYARCRPPTKPIRPSNLTTKGIYARCVAGRTPPWTRTGSRITSVGCSSAKTVKRSWSTTKTRRTYAAVRTECSASTIKCASYGRASEKAKRWLCPSKPSHLALPPGHF